MDPVFTSTTTKQFMEAHIPSNRRSSPPAMEAGIRVLKPTKGNDVPISTTPTGSPAWSKLEISTEIPVSVPLKPLSEDTSDEGAPGRLPKDVHSAKPPSIPQKTCGRSEPIEKDQYRPKNTRVPQRQGHDQVFLGTESGRILKAFPDEKLKLNRKSIDTKDKKRPATQNTLTPLKERYKGNFWDLTAAEKEVLRNKPLHPNPNGLTSSTIAAIFAAPGPSKEGDMLAKFYKERGHAGPHTHRVWPSPRAVSKDRTKPEEKKRKRALETVSEGDEADPDVNRSPKKRRPQASKPSRTTRPLKSINTTTSKTVAPKVDAKDKAARAKAEPDERRIRPREPSINEIPIAQTMGNESGAAHPVRENESPDRLEGVTSGASDNHQDAAVSANPEKANTKKSVFASFAGAASKVFTFCTPFVPSTSFPFVQTRTTRATRARRLAADAAKARKANKMASNVSALAALAAEANARANDKKQMEVLDAALDSVLQQARLFGVTDNELVDRLQKRSMVWKRELGWVGNTRNWVGGQMLKKAEQLDRHKEKLLYG
ncbi:hypothetical protein BU16DRAFT_565106 [Lophium mytilinum]|uniref:Uncharacterized protein n=1 Tax=Lophium mytilinum TaxID=390894 RepID=A0A6A6QH69_9PEZI|nr:hypothetical protein BU16DRAFT_565106 [Lophium mytilinum]